jgi:hypothetical protein
MSTLQMSGVTINKPFKLIDNDAKWEYLGSTNNMVFAAPDMSARCNAVTPSKVCFYARTFQVFVVLYDLEWRP